MTDCLWWIRKFQYQSFTTNLFPEKLTVIERCRAMTYKCISRYFVFFIDYCWNSSFFRFASVIKWQKISRFVHFRCAVCSLVCSVQFSVQCAGDMRKRTYNRSTTPWGCLKSTYFLFFCQFLRFSCFFADFSNFRQKNFTLYRRFTQNHWLKNNYEHCFGKA